MGIPKKDKNDSQTDWIASLAINTVGDELMVVSDDHRRRIKFPKRCLGGNENNKSADHQEETGKILE